MESSPSGKTTQLSSDNSISAPQFGVFALVFVKSICRSHYFFIWVFICLNCWYLHVLDTDICSVVYFSAVLELLCDLMYNITMYRVHASVQGLVFEAVLKQEIAFFDGTQTGTSSTFNLDKRSISGCWISVRVHHRLSEVVTIESNRGCSNCRLNSAC